MKPALPAGEYRVHGKEKTYMEAICNGHGFLWGLGEVTAKCDGQTVTFFRTGRRIWDCNSAYAAQHFIFEAKEK